MRVRTRKTQTYTTLWNALTNFMTYSMPLLTFDCVKYINLSYVITFWASGAHRKCTLKPILLVLKWFVYNFVQKLHFRYEKNLKIVNTYCKLILNVFWWVEEFFLTNEKAFCVCRPASYVAGSFFSPVSGVYSGDKCKNKIHFL